jgi:biopolymer transport protein TolR
MAIGAASGNDSASRSAGSTYATLRRKHSRRAINEINVTPLVDVVLVLLLVFMVTAPMMSQGIDVNLPTANQVDNPKEDRLTVSLSAEGRAYIGTTVYSLLLLEDKIREHLARHPTQVVYIRADQNARHGKVVEVLDLLKRCGVERIGFAYELPKETS